MIMRMFQAQTQFAENFLGQAATITWRQVRSLFRQELAIDLGTARTRIYAPGKGIVLDEPSLIAIQMETDEVIAVGTEAQLLFGRAPENIRVFQPLQAGVITNYLAFQRMLEIFLRSVTRRKLRWSTHLLFSVPSDLTPLELKAFRMAAVEAGGTRIRCVEEAVASAMGAGISEDCEHASVVVDIGAGTTDIAVINGGDMVQSSTLRLGGNDLDQAIIRYLRQSREIETGAENAERIKIKLFALREKSELDELEIRGRSLSTRLPEYCTITHSEVNSAVFPLFSRITQFIRITLEDLPLKLALDLLDTGVILCGGSALIPGLASWLADELKLGVYLAAEPKKTTIYGLARLLEDDPKSSSQKLLITGFEQNSVVAQN
jgi:rod shape-determining protein MreB and related proteins